VGFVKHMNRVSCIAYELIYMRRAGMAAVELRVTISLSNKKDAPRY